MDFALRQRGRALMDFEVSARRMAGRLQAAAEQELGMHGITTRTLPEDMDDRHKVIDQTLAGSKTFRMRALLQEWGARQHGLAAAQAFAEI